MTGLSLTIVLQIMENTEIHHYDPSPTVTRIAERDRSRLSPRRPADVTVEEITIVGAAFLVP